MPLQTGVPTTLPTGVRREPLPTKPKNGSDTDSEGSPQEALQQLFPKEISTEPPPYLPNSLPTNLPTKLTTIPPTVVSQPRVKPTSLAVSGAVTGQDSNCVKQLDIVNGSVAGAAIASVTNINGNGNGDELSTLLERFPLLHRQGLLEEAAETLHRALGIMEGTTREASRRDINSEQIPPDLDANGLGGDKAGVGLGLKSIDGDGMGSMKEISAMAGVMNDLGCTLQQVC